MTTEKGSRNYVWVVILVLSLLIIAWSVLVLAFSRDSTLNDGLTLAGSRLVAGDFDDATLGFLNMVMLKPLSEEGWIGIQAFTALSDFERRANTLGRWVSSGES